MKINSRSVITCTMLTALILIIGVTSTRLKADSGSCGGATISLPFTDVAGNIFFCEIAAAFFSGLTNGTTATTYSPGQNVPREQMAAFVTRTMDQSLRRGSRRAALKQFWTPTSANGIGVTFVGPQPFSVESDGADLWVAHSNNAMITRVRASDGKLLGTWTGATNVASLLVARGMIFGAATTNPGTLYRIDPTLPAGTVTTITHFLGDSPVGIAFDGARIWTSNGGGSVSIVTLNPFTVRTVTNGFFSPVGILFDGANIWVVDQSTHNLQRLDSNGAIIQSVPVDVGAWFPVFDGTNIWVPNTVSDSVTVIRASTGTVIATLVGNGLDQPQSAAFDGERILVTNFHGNSVSLWQATDLTPLGSIPVGQFSGPGRACSDGINFWFTLLGTGQLARF